jgi:putative transposase
MILAPSDEGGLGLAVGAAYRRYTNFVNARGRWSGHLFQSRFASAVMDEAHLTAAARYVPMNPVRAGLVARAGDWPWSSARAHLAGREDELVTVRPLLDRVGDFAGFLAAGRRLGRERIESGRNDRSPAGERRLHRGARADPGPQARAGSARAAGKTGPRGEGSVGIGIAFLAPPSGHWLAAAEAESPRRRQWISLASSEPATGLA